MNAFNTPVRWQAAPTKTQTWNIWWELPQMSNVPGYQRSGTFVYNMSTCNRSHFKPAHSPHISLHQKRNWSLLPRTNPSPSATELEEFQTAEQHGSLAVHPIDPFQLTSLSDTASMTCHVGPVLNRTSVTLHQKLWSVKLLLSSVSLATLKSLPSASRIRLFLIRNRSHSTLQERSSLW